MTKYRLTLRNKAGWESMAFETGGYLNALVNRITALLEDTDIEWCLGSAGVVPFFPDSDTTGTMEEAIAMVQRWKME